MNNTGYYQQGGYNPATDFYGNPTTFGYDNTPIKRTKNLLTDEEITMLQKKASQFTLGLTPEEVLKAQCTHRDKNGNLALVDRADGSKVCTVCGEVFNETDLNSEDVKLLIKKINDVIQSIKVLYYDMPAQAAREYYQISPLLNKLPKLLEIAVDNFNKYDTLSGIERNDVNPFMQFQSFVNGGYPNMGGMAMGPQMMNPGMMYQQQATAPMNQPPMMSAPMGAVPPQGNPFYGQPQQGYVPQVQGYSYDLNAAQQQAVAPQPQQSTGTTTQAVANVQPQTGEVKVNAQMQA